MTPFLTRFTLLHPPHPQVCRCGHSCGAHETAGYESVDAPLGPCDGAVAPPGCGCAAYRTRCRACGADGQEE